MEINIHLRDIHPGMVLAWRRHFQGTDVTISQGDIFEHTADALVSPANSFGFMDGGIDLVYSRRFGWGLQRRLQQVLAQHHYGELPVGQAVVVETEDPEIPWLVSAPTMRVPRDISETVNAYLAFRATLLAIDALNKNAAAPIRTLLCPGLGTAIGRMPHDQAAKQMRAAYDVCVLGEQLSFQTLLEAVHEHVQLLR